MRASPDYFGCKVINEDERLAGKNGVKDDNDGVKDDNDGTQMNTHKYIYTNIYTQIYTHPNIYTHLHTHTLSCSSVPQDLGQILV